jgi:hypothetical protein
MQGSIPVFLDVKVVHTHLNTSKFLCIIRDYVIAIENYCAKDREKT